MYAALPVVEKFHSLQGEGAHAGRSAFFIRLASCNVQCPWCDTKESWSEKNHPKEALSQLAKQTVEASDNGASFVVITGGEPLHHNLTPLCNVIRTQTLNSHGKSIPIHIETSGVNNLSGNPDWITLSPKRHALPQTEIFNACHEIKVIVHDPQDLVFAEEMASKVPQKTSKEKSVLLFLQPGWNNQAGQKLAFNYVKNNPNWRLSVQAHKWLGIQ